MPIARPEYGPSLVDVVAPRARRIPRRVWIAVAVAVLVLAAAITAFLLGRARPETQVVIRGPLTFNTRFDDRTRREAAGPGELLRLHVAPVWQTGPDGKRIPKRGEETLVFRDGGAAPPRPEPAGAPIAQLSVRMVPIVRQIRAEFAAIPGSDFQLRGEGRVKIGKDNAGWLVRYQFRRDGRIWYGVRLLLLPDVEGTRDRVLDMSLRTQSSPVVPNIRLAGSNGPMRTPFYGVAFGTEAP
ncbi:hypothetical protein [Patulibacter defluvii]|uniref:hypothetical protein n=1 Tax=Patulibacter defluvii TaxID=3095358 RepID=UPI002A750A1D|nr:hypothetical protein [Patulibacter sp. DM4]